MTRPFRFQPPAPSERLLERPRLLEQLARRWAVRLVTVVAGPGFGKSAALASAVESADRPDGALDVWLSCEPADESEAHLAVGIAHGLGAPPDSSLEDLVDRVWAKAPAPVCLVFDDVHEITDGTGGATLLATLLTELPRNGHVVLSSRDPVPVPSARLAAAGQIERLVEEDLLFDAAELDAFARARGIDPALLRSTGGWPALAELTASAGRDLVLDYLREEVLASIGTERAHSLARFALVGGGDDSIAAAIGASGTVDDLVRGVPLVDRSVSGSAALHPLWLPALVRLLDETEARSAYRAAAAAHQQAGRTELAVELLAEAEAWDQVLTLVRDLVLRPVAEMPTHEIARLHRMLPRRLRREPAALLLAALMTESSRPLDAVPTLQEARAAFRSRGDIEGELAAIGREGVVRWWAQDLGRLLPLLQRVAELAAAGSDAAKALGSIGSAAAAHAVGDSEAVLSHLAGIDEVVFADWLYAVHWLRSVAYRRTGDLAAARHEIARAAERSTGRRDRILRMAEQHIAWLSGHVDDAYALLTDVIKDPAQSDGHRYLSREVSLELAAKAAWLGDLDTSAEIVSSDTTLDDMPNLRASSAIARAGVAIGRGDEAAATRVLREVVGDSLDTTQRWYWRDRLAITLTHVLLPGTRPTWAQDALGEPHLPGVLLAEALEAARAGDPGPVANLRWPEPGVVRAHLPVAWIAELAVAADAAGNPPPDELLRAVGAPLRDGLMIARSRATAASVAASAARLIGTVPPTPTHHLRVEVLGPLAVRCDGARIDSPELRRRRVRELLCYLTVHRRARRETIAENLWPETADSGRNLRVTLTYLQRILQPERHAADPPFFVRADGEWLVLSSSAHLAVDAWELDAHLDRADAAERAGNPTEALLAYRAALPLWQGEPYGDAPFAIWALGDRARLTQRYIAGAIRAGELLVAAGDVPDARDAAEHAISADPASEQAARLLASIELDAGDRRAARRVLDRYQAALAELGVTAEPATLDLIRAAQTR